MTNWKGAKLSLEPRNKKTTRQNVYLKQLCNNYFQKGKICIYILKGPIRYLLNLTKNNQLQGTPYFEIA